MESSMASRSPNRRSFCLFTKAVILTPFDPALRVLGAEAPRLLVDFLAVTFLAAGLAVFLVVAFRAAGLEDFLVVTFLAAGLGALFVAVFLAVVFLAALEGLALAVAARFFVTGFAAFFFAGAFTGLLAEAFFAVVFRLADVVLGFGFATFFLTEPVRVDLGFFDVDMLLGFKSLT